MGSALGLTLVVVLALVLYGGYRLAALTTAQIAEYERVESSAASLPTPPAVSAEVGLPLGEAEHRWTLERPDGSLVTLGDFRGQAVLVSLFSRTCRPCLAELPSLERLSVAVRERLVVLVVATDSVDEYRQFVAAFKPAVQIYRAHDPVPVSLATGVLPTTYVIDGEGNLRYRHVGAANWAAASFSSSLHDLLQH